MTKKISKTDRARIVELLRCAADLALRNTRQIWLDHVAQSIAVDDEVVEIARGVARMVMDKPPYLSQRANYQGDVMPNSWSMVIALEAALLVEEGTAP